MTRQRGNYWFCRGPGPSSIFFPKDAGIISKLAILSPSFSLMATEPLVFLPSALIYTNKQTKNGKHAFRLRHTNKKAEQYTTAANTKGSNAFWKISF